jgi:catalase
MKSNDDVGLLVAKSRESTPGPILMSDREPHTDTATWTTMVVTLLMDDANGTYLKFHFKTAQGIRISRMGGGTNESKWYGFLQRDLMENIDAEKFSMEFENSGNDQKNRTARIITWTRSTWLGLAYADYPLIDVGVLEWIRIP